MLSRYDLKNKNKFKMIKKSKKMNDYERLLTNELKKNNLQSNIELTISNIQEDVAKEFGILTDEDESRETEIQNIKEEIVDLNKQLTKYRNIKNPRMQQFNEKRYKKRKEITKKINLLKLRLEEINEEIND